MSRLSAAVLGGGPAGLMAAEVLAAGGLAVTVYDRMPTVGRKFLMAGRGGLNLTHSEPLADVLGRYDSAAPQLLEAVRRFPPERLRAWCEALGEATFVGSSGRVFPASMKASPLLRAWLRRLAAQGVAVALRHRWTGWSEDGGSRFETPFGARAMVPDVTVLACGGASWPQLGSDGTWTGPVGAAGFDIAPLRPANCGFAVDWSSLFKDRFEGVPLKNVALRYEGRSARGDVIVTRSGLEGGAIYPLSGPLRERIDAQGFASLTVDLRPDTDPAALAARLAGRAAGQSLSNTLRKTLRLAPAAIGLLHEAALAQGRPLAQRSPEEIASLIRSVPVRLSGVGPLAPAISTAGGLSFAMLDDRFMLRGRPGVFAAGEMLDWDAPTGGYLLQACFATGAAAAAGALAWIESRADAPRTEAQVGRFLQRRN